MTIDGAARPAGSPPSRTEIDYCVARAIPTDAIGEVAAKYGINRPGGQFFVSPSLTTVVLRLQPRPAGVQGAGADPAQEGDQLRDRPPGARPGVRLPRRQAHRPDAAARARAATSSIYPLKGADPATARKWLARARLQPTHARPLRVEQPPSASQSAQVFAFNLKQIGIDVEVKYFDPSVAGTRRRVPGGSRSTSSSPAGAPTMPIRPAFFVPLLTRTCAPPATRTRRTSTTRRLTRGSTAASRLTGAARRKAWADLDADLMRNDPPWAPFVARRQSVTSSRGASAASSYHPVYAPRPRRRLQEVAWSRTALSSRCCDAGASARLCSLRRCSRGRRRAPPPERPPRARGRAGRSAGHGLRTSTSSIRRSRTSGVRGRSSSRPARSSSTTRTRRARRGRV